MESVHERAHLTKKRQTETPVRELTRLAVEAAQEKKALDIVVMDMRQVSGLADFFVLATGVSDIQVKAVYEAVEDRIRKAFGERPWHREGEDHRQWVLLDYVDLVVHVFNPERRAFYDLERLWSDAPMEHVPYDADSTGSLDLLRDDRP